MNNVADKLYNILGTKFNNTDIKTLDSKGKETTDMEEIEMFSFDFLVNSKNYGPVVILLSANDNLEVYYGDNTSKSLDTDARKKWENLIEHLSTFARTNRLGFSLKHTSDLKYDLSNIADITESYRNIFEGYYGTKKTSYSPQGKAKIIIKHSKAIGEEDKRFRNISSLFIENSDGERFKLPFKKLAGARAMARHVTEGGNPYDLFGVHISEMVNDINTLGGFVRRSKMYEGNDEAMSMVETGRTHYNEMRKSLKRIAGVRGYGTYKESWEPSAITEQETDTSAIRNLFMDKKVNQRTEDALPLLARLQKMVETSSQMQDMERNSQEDSLRAELSQAQVDGTPDEVERLQAELNKLGEAREMDQAEKIDHDVTDIPYDWEEDPENRDAEAERSARHAEYYEVDETIDWPEEVKSKEFPGDNHPDSPEDEHDDTDIPVSMQYGVGQYGDDLDEGNYEAQVRRRNKLAGKQGGNSARDIDNEPKKTSRPTEVEIYKKIKDWSLVALKGYARRIKMPRELVDQRNADEDTMIDEIMGYLFDDDWEIKLIKAGAFSESVITEQYEKERSAILIDFLEKEGHRGEFDTLTLTSVLGKKGYGLEPGTLEQLLLNMEKQGLVTKTGTTNLLGSGSFSYSTWRLTNTTGNEMKEISEFKEWADKITEGTWAFPDSPDTRTELKQFMATEQPLGIDAMNATDSLYDILGADDLFDELQNIAKDDPEADARPIVKNYVQTMYRDIDQYAEEDQPNIKKLYRSLGKNMGEGFSQDLDADGEAQLNASYNKDIDKYIQKEDVSAEEYANSNVWNESNDESDSGEKPTDNKGNEDYEDDESEELNESLDNLMQRTNFLLKK